MKMPSKNKTELYPLTESDDGIVHITNSGKFKVEIIPCEKLLPGEKFRITIRDDDSFEFETFDEVKEYLL